MAIGLLILRLALGLTLAAHGAGKLRGPRRPLATGAGLGELAGGLLLALGLVTPLAAAAIMAAMVVAIGTEGGLEHSLLRAMAALTLAFTGPGAWALDPVLGITHEGVGWGLATAAIGLIGGGIPLAARNLRSSHHAHA
jgi:putative oxidoreductase